MSIHAVNFPSSPVLLFPHVSRIAEQFSHSLPGKEAVNFTSSPVLLLPHVSRIAEQFSHSLPGKEAVNFPVYHSTNCQMAGITPVEDL